jgi:hypothetical protein
MDELQCWGEELYRQAVGLDVDEDHFEYNGELLRHLGGGEREADGL